MQRRTTEEAKAKLLFLIGQGVPVAAAATAAGIPRSTAARIAATASGPFQGQQGQPNTPTIDWTNDQPDPPPSAYAFRSGYHDHTYRSFSAPLAFDGFTLRRVRDAVSLHRQGIFLESSTLALALLSFGPVLAATGQRLSPSLALPRRILAGTRGLSRVLGAEVEAQLAPRSGLLPSPYFPPTLWGSMGFDLAFMGFSVMQHVDGPEDPETGIRPRYTRRWPTWATNYYRWRKTFVAQTTEGPVDILNDGKFTLVADSDEPHFLGAIVALAEEALDGKFTQRARATYIDRYGNPKWVGTMPPGVGVRTPEGSAMFDALSTIRGPDGFGVVPNGATFDVKAMAGSQSSAFKDALDSNWQFVAAILLGSDGTMTRGTGVYSAPIFAGVRRDLVDRDLKAQVRGVNVGHIAPYLAGNYAASIADAGGWVDPVLDIPLPDPDGDARIKSYSDRVTKFHEIVDAERDNGFVITQERVNQLAESLSIDPPTLGSVQLTKEDRSKVVLVGEARESAGLELLGDDRDDLMLVEVDAPAKTTETVEAVADGEPPPDAAPAEQGASQSSSDATGNGGSSTGDDPKE